MGMRITFLIRLSQQGRRNILWRAASARHSSKHRDIFAGGLVCREAVRHIHLRRRAHRLLHRQYAQCTGHPTGETEFIYPQRLQWGHRIYSLMVAARDSPCYGEKRRTPQICAEWHFCAKKPLPYGSGSSCQKASQSLPHAGGKASRYSSVQTALRRKLSKRAARRSTLWSMSFSIWFQKNCMTKPM